MSKIILNKNKNGNFEPFKTFELAEKHIETNLDGIGTVSETDGGFCIMAGVAKPKMKYFRVQVEARKSATENAQHSITCNGIKYHVTKGTITILPEPWIEIAENSLVQMHEMHDSVLVDSGSFKRCGMARLEEVDKSVFDKALKEGNLQLKRDIETRDQLAKTKGK